MFSCENVLSSMVLTLAPLSIINLIEVSFTRTFTHGGNYLFKTGLKPVIDSFKCRYTTWRGDDVRVVSGNYFSSKLGPMLGCGIFAIKLLLGKQAWHSSHDQWPPINDEMWVRIAMLVRDYSLQSIIHQSCDRSTKIINVWD